ncbi:MAG: hypothetical protein RR466_11435, partial [Hungatella sp.]
ILYGNSTFSMPPYILYNLRCYEDGLAEYFATTVLQCSSVKEFVAKELFDRRCNVYQFPTLV